MPRTRECNGNQQSFYEEKIRLLSQGLNDENRKKLDKLSDSRRKKVIDYMIQQGALV